MVKKRRSRSSRRSRHGNSDAWVQENASRWTRGAYVITRTADGFVLKDWSGGRFGVYGTLLAAKRRAGTSERVGRSQTMLAREYGKHLDRAIRRSR